MRTGASDPVQVRISRALATEMRDAYPASAHDIVLEIGSGPTAAEVPDLLAAIVAAIQAGDPACRRTILPIAIGDLPFQRAAEEAGFRYVVDVDIDDREVVLFVAEPHWVTEVDMDLDRVPGS